MTPTPGGPLVADLRRPAGRTGTALARPPDGRLPLVAVGIGVALLPMLNPKGPFNTAPVDLVLGAGILAALLWAGTTRAPIHLPYVVPLGLLAVAGFAALFGTAPIRGGAAIIQEVFLLAWCAAIVIVCTTPKRLRVLLRVWCLSALTWAVFLIVCSLSGKIRFPGGTNGYGDRARLWFDHPNLAGNYFILAVFVVLAARYPRRPLLRAVAVIALVAAIMLTGSNTALLCLPVGVLVIIFLRVRDQRGPAPALAICACLMVAGGVLWTTVGQSTLESLQHNDNPLLRYSVARTSRSAEGRESLFSSSFDLYRNSNVVGVGPAATRHTLEKAGADVAKEAHNDYLGTLVERGPLGIIALVTLAGTIAVRAVGVQRLRPVWAEVVPEPAALAGGAAGFLVTALTHEVLHYRHLWTLLAVLGVLFLVRDHRPRQPDHAPIPWDLAPAQADGR